MATQSDAGPFKPQKLVVVPSPPQTPRVELKVSDDLPVKKFMERKDLRQDRFEYERMGDEPGYILIFNQEVFDNKELTRRGSKRDVNEIIICLQRQGFNIDKENIHTDKTTDEIKDKLDEVAQTDFTNHNCLIVFFLSHGEERNCILTKDGEISAEKIWLAFNNSKGLKNKPKIFIFQTCKGSDYATVGDQKSKTNHIAPISTFSADKLYNDLLIVHSAIEGYCAYRSPLTGTWFIQELCKNFTAYGRKEDIVSLIIRTTKCVCGNYFLSGRDRYTGTEFSNAKQMPFFISTLRKKFYLNRNKERDAILQIAETGEKILTTVVQIKNQLEGILAKEEEQTKKK